MTDLNSFHKNLGDMLIATERCLQLHQHLPALVLMCSLIDSLAWAATGDIQPKVRERFEDWVNSWLLRELKSFAPAVSATDLYAARCAVLHTLTGDSDLSKAGHAKRFLYAWGTGKTEILQAAIKATNQNSHLALHYDDLLYSLVHATTKFIDGANQDPALATRLDAAAAKHYINIDAPSPNHENRA